jgi:transcriptional antiterminator RfaH
MGQDRDLSWFLAQLKPNSLKIAQRNLIRQGFRAFAPSEEVTKRVKSKFVTKEQPLFPGYVFVAFDVAQGGWRAVNSTQGVTRLVSFGARPCEVPRPIMSQLLERCDETGKLLPEPEYHPGDHVTITHGVFANFVAEVSALAPDRRVWVLLDIMGGQTRVSVPKDALRAV